MSHHEPYFAGNEIYISEELTIVKKLFPIIALAIVSLIASASLGWASSTGVGSIDVEILQIETPYISGCCAYLEDPIEILDFDVYKSSSISGNYSPVVITLQSPGESREKLRSLNLELARRNLTVVSIHIPSSINDTMMQMKGRQLGDIMAFLRDTETGISRDYAVVASSYSAGIAFSMNFLINHPYAIVTLGYLEGYDEHARFYEGNLLQLMNQNEIRERIDDALEISSKRTGVENPEIGLIYGEFSNRNATLIDVISQDDDLDFNSNAVIMRTTDWILRTFYSEVELAEIISADETLLTLTSSISLTSDILLGIGFLSGVIAIVEYRRMKQ